MKYFPFLLLTLLFSACKSPIEKEAVVIKYDSIILEKNLQDLFEQTGSAGMGIALFNENQILFENAYGFRNRKDSLPYTVTTTQNIASISKIVTGLTLLKAIENTEVQLSDDVNKYLPFSVRNPSFTDVPITLEHLVTHTSSIHDGDFYSNSYYTLENDYQNNPEIDQEEVSGLPPKDKALQLEEYLKNALIEKDTAGYVNYKPGSVFNYSNNGAGLIALLVEGITGTEFKKYSQEQIIEPLGLKSSTWQDVIDQNHSVLYSTDSLRYPHYGLVTAADGAYRTNVSELSILGQELIKGHQNEGRLLNAISYSSFYQKRLDSTHFKTEDSIKDHVEDGFNKGVFITYEHGGIGHSGGDPGVTTLLYFNADTHKGYTLLLNTDFNSEEQYNAFIKIAELMNKEIAKKDLK